MKGHEGRADMERIENARHAEQLERRGGAEPTTAATGGRWRGKESAGGDCGGNRTGRFGGRPDSRFSKRAGMEKRKAER